MSKPISTTGSSSPQPKQPLAAANRQNAYSPNFMRPNDTVDINTRNLPHWHQDHTLAFVTWHLADSLPLSEREKTQKRQKAFLNEYPEPWDEATLQLYRKNVSEKMEAFLDTGHGSCVMKDPEIRKEVESALRFFDDQRYRLHAFVVMPNHVHVLFKIFPSHPLMKTIHSWKSYTAQTINKKLKQNGPLWQEECWDRLIRNEKHYRNTLTYIYENNPKIAYMLVDM